jgi:hypothetical protein
MLVYFIFPVCTPVGFLDEFVDLAVGHEMGTAAHVGILIQAVRPALGDALLGPQVVRILGQRVDQLFHLSGQRHGAQVERRWFVTIALRSI